MTNFMLGDWEIMELLAQDNLNHVEVQGKCLSKGR